MVLFSIISNSNKLGTTGLQMTKRPYFCSFFAGGRGGIPPQRGGGIGGSEKGYYYNIMCLSCNNKIDTRGSA